MSLLPMMIILIGIIVGIGASFTGLGGGFLMVPVLLFLGFTHSKAVGTSFLAILLISISALAAHGKLDHVDYKMGVLLAMGGIMGAQVGARLVDYVDGDTFNRIFSIILIALALYIFKQTL